PHWAQERRARPDRRGWNLQSITTRPQIARGTQLAASRHAKGAYAAPVTGGSHPYTFPPLRGECLFPRGVSGAVDGCRWCREGGAVEIPIQRGSSVMTPPAMEGLRLNAPAYVKNARLIAWVAEMAALAQPDSIYWCDGSQEEYDRLCDALVSAGTLRRLNPAK